MPKKKEEIDLVNPSNPGFIEKVTPKTDTEKLHFFKCMKEHPQSKNPCNTLHFRHAGYVQLMLPFLKPGGGKEMLVESRQVMICVKCKSSYIWDGDQMYDVSHHVDLQAWEATEKEAHKATGPGGQC